MSRHNSLHAAAFLAAFVVVAPLHAGVITVDDDGPADYSQISVAIANSSDGDTILVKSGTYSSVPILGRVVDVIADDGAIVNIDGYIGVVGLPAGQSVLLSGLNATAALDIHYGLFLQDCQGSVRVQDCSFVGYTPPLLGGCPEQQLLPGGDAILIDQCRDVSITRSAATGGSGQSTTNFFCFYFGGIGGDALGVSSSSVALQDSALAGGTGGTNGYAGGGGHGVRASDTELFASGGSITGGDGGLTQDILPLCEDGGDGIRLDPASTAHVLDVLVAGGAKGYWPGNQGNCSDGLPFAGAGTFDFLSLGSRSFAATAVVREGNTAHLTFSGVPGDTVYLASASDHGYTYLAGHNGVWLLRYPARIRTSAVGVLDGTGNLALDVPVGSVALPPGARNLALQALFFGVGGEIVVGPPTEIVVLDSSF